MLATRPADILRHLEPDAVSDAELLAQFQRDEAAFAKLVRRHGPMILSVCRRITRHTEDAEDAFQAVFLILAKKASSVREPRLLGNWLYGVAARVAQKARRGSVRRRAREVQTVNAPEPLAPPVAADDDVGAALHEELAKLPAKFREPIVLCDLRGITRTEAAQILGIAVGTLHSRLSAGREKLARQLKRRGIALAAAAIPAALTDGAAAGVIPDSLVTKTCGLVAGWQAGAAVPAAVLRLTQGGLPMRMTFLMGMMGAVLATAGVVMATRPDEPKPSDPPKPIAPVVQGPAVAAPNAKEDRFTTKPRLQHTIDLPIRSASKLVWSPDGKRLAIVGTVAYGSEGLRVILIHEIDSDPRTQAPRRIACQLPAALIGITPDSKNVITALREYSLVSGRHELLYSPMEGKPKRPIFNGIYWDPDRTVDLGVEPTYEYAFAADGKTYRTIFFEGGLSPDGNGPIEVREISTETGKSVRTLLKVEGSFDRYILSPNGNRLVVQDSRGGITVWNVGKGRKESLPRKPAEPTKRQPQPFRFRPGDGPGPKELVPGPDQPRGEVSMFFSPDSRYLLMVDFFGISIFDNENGRFLPELEGNVGNVSRHVMPSGSFSARNQLLALTGMVVVAGGHERSFLKVWELKTGKLLKGWPHSPQVAWSPAAPVLAVIEANGRGGTRLGLWDFAAEVATKPRP